MRENLNKYHPRRELEIFAYALVSIDIKGNELAAERLTKVGRFKFRYAMQTNPEFRQWYSDLCYQVLLKNEAIPTYALMGAIIDKDVQAIRTYYELIGKIKKQGDVNVTQIVKTGAASNANGSRFTGEDRELVESIRQRVIGPVSQK